MSIIGHDKYILSKYTDDDIYQMSNVWRYSGRLIHKAENLAEHSFYVAFNVHRLGEEFGVDAERVNKACKIALCHDCGEIYTGDIPHSLKVYSPKIKDISEELEVKLIKENFPVFGESFESFNNREDEVVTLLVELADVSDVIMFIDRETRLGNIDNDILGIRSESIERFVKLSMQLETELKKEREGK